MKTQIFAALFLSFTLNMTLTNAAIVPHDVVRASDSNTCASPLYQNNDPFDIKVVISQKRIWLIADEMPMKCLKTIVKNEAGQIVLEKCFSSKCSEWFLNIEALPKGEYTLQLGNNQVEKFKK